MGTLWIFADVCKFPKSKITQKSSFLKDENHGRISPHEVSAQR